MRKTAGRIAAYTRRAASKTLSEMHCMFSRWIDIDPSRTKGMRKRLFCPIRTFRLFLSQVMSGNISCTETVQKALAWLCYHQGKMASQNNAGYCKARTRLRGQLLERFNGMMNTLLYYIARNTVPDRANRFEPRAKKRRPKNYQLLNKPQSEFKEIHHRNKYTKPLS